MTHAASTDELLDVVDPSTGAVLEQRTRTEVHELGLWHQVFHCLIVRPSSGTVVLQERSMAKKAFPGKLDLSATGHLEAGERPIDGLRELEEELGVVLPAGAAVPVGHRLLADDGGEGRNRELVHLFFAVDERPLSDFSLAVDEVSAVVEVRADDLLELLSDSSPVVPTTRWSPGAAQIDSTMERTDLVADTDGYWTVVAVMADRFLRGESPLAV